MNHNNSSKSSTIKSKLSPHYGSQGRHSLAPVVENKEEKMKTKKLKNFSNVICLWGEGANTDMNTYTPKNNEQKTPLFFTHREHYHNPPLERTAGMKLRKKGRM